jgi:hypothetical protein
MLINDFVVNGAFNTHGERDKCIQNFVGKSEVSSHRCT